MLKCIAIALYETQYDGSGLEFHFEYDAIL